MIAPLTELAIEALSDRADDCLSWIDLVAATVSAGGKVDHWHVAITVHDWHRVLSRARR